MTKQRMPGSIEDALIIIYATIGYPTAVSITKRTESHLRRWSDPDDDSLPNISQAMALDAECLRQTGQAPLLQVYSHWMQQIAKQEEASGNKCFSHSIVEMADHLGAISREVSKALAPDSDEGARMSPNEAIEALKPTQLLRRALNELEAMLQRATKCPPRLVMNSS